MYGRTAGVAGYCLNLHRIASCCWLFASCPLLACTHKCVSLCTGRRLDEPSAFSARESDCAPRWGAALPPPAAAHAAGGAAPACHILHIMHPMLLSFCSILHGLLMPTEWDGMEWKETA